MFIQSRRNLLIASAAIVVALLAVTVFFYFRSNDPVRSFNGFAKRLSNHYEGLYKKRMENLKERSEAYSVKYDVLSIQKTDDLVNPYQANVSFEKTGPQFYRQIDAVFVLRDGKWQYKSHALRGRPREGVEGQVDRMLEGYEIQESGDVANGEKDVTSIDKIKQRAENMLK